MLHHQYTMVHHGTLCCAISPPWYTMVHHAAPSVHHAVPSVHHGTPCCAISTPCCAISTPWYMLRHQYTLEMHGLLSGPRPCRVLSISISEIVSSVSNYNVQGFMNMHYQYPGPALRGTEENSWAPPTIMRAPKSRWGTQSITFKLGNLMLTFSPFLGPPTTLFGIVLSRTGTAPCQ